MGVSYTPFASLPVPDENAARDVPGWLALLAEQLDVSVVLKAVDATDRNSKYSNAPMGTMVVSTTDGTVWVKTSSDTTLPATWGVVYQPPAAVVWTPCILQSPYVAYGHVPEAALINGIVRLRGLFGTATTTFGTIQYVLQLPSAVPFPRDFLSFPGSSSNGVVGRIDVGPDGLVWYSPPASAPVPFWVATEAISYYPTT